MPKKSDPFEAIRGEVAESRIYVRMLEPMSDAELGGKLPVGKCLNLGIAKARRWVEDIGVAEVISEEDYQEYLSEQERIRLEREEAPVFDARIRMNVNQTNANFAALSSDPNAFDPTLLPRANEERQAAARQRGGARRGVPSAPATTIEEQLAALDAPQVGAQGASGKPAPGAEAKPPKKPEPVPDPSTLTSADAGDDGDDGDD